MYLQSQILSELYIHIGTYVPSFSFSRLSVCLKQIYIFENFKLQTWRSRGMNLQSRIFSELSIPICTGVPNFNFLEHG